MKIDKFSNFEILSKKNSLKFAIFMLSIFIGLVSNKLDVEASDFNNNVIEHTELEGIIKNYEFYLEDGENDFQWVNDNPNIEELQVNIMTTKESEIRKLSKLRELKKLRKLVLFTRDNVSITNAEFQFLTECPSLETLVIDGPSIEKGIIESIVQIKKLSINVFSHIYNQIDVDFRKLTFLDNLDFMDSLPYDITIFFDLESYNLLQECGVSVTANDSSCIKEMVEVNEILDNMVRSLDIKAEDSEVERFDKVLLYVMDLLEYDEEVLNSKDDKLAKTFYEKGFLYGALEKNSAICGNYASLLTALCRRSGINSYCLCSSKHAWDLVNIDDTYYFTDPTCLDGKTLTVEHSSLFSDTFEEEATSQAIKEGFIDINLYLDSPYEVMKNDNNDYFEVKNMPSYIDISSDYYSFCDRKLKTNFSSFSEIYAIAFGSISLLDFFIGLGIYIEERKIRRQNIFNKCLEEIQLKEKNSDKVKQYKK